jgi:transcription elongation factor Elf1
LRRKKSNESVQKRRGGKISRIWRLTMKEKQLPITCPLCGRKNSFAVEMLVEGSTIVCRFCGVSLKLHGHMLEDIRKEMAKLKD